MPPLKHIDQTGPFQHGKTIYDYRLEPRIIQLVFRENAQNRQGYWDVRANILNFLRINRQSTTGFNLGTLRKITPNGAKRDINVIVEQGPEFRAREVGRWDEWSILETVRFIAPDPTFYDPAVVSATHVAGGGAIADFAITYPGTWLAYPSIVVTGPIDDLVITNVETGEVLDLTGYILAAGRTITFDLTFGQKTVTESVAGNIIGFLTDDSDLTTFHLATDPEVAGGLNTIEVAGSAINNGVTSVQFDYYTRYIGI
jgi:hypothetical protein